MFDFCVSAPRNFTATTQDGWALDVAEYERPDQPKGAVLLPHAMMVNRDTFHRGGQGLAPFLAVHGWWVFTANFRGRGPSGPTPREGGAWTYDDLVYFDLPALVGAVREKVGSLPLTLMGHSLGGHTGLAAAGLGLFSQPPDAIVALSANMWQPSHEPQLIRRIAKSLSLFALMSTARVFGAFPARRLGMGPCDEATPYIEDLRRTWTADHWGSRDGSADFTAAMASVDFPVLSVIGRGDKFMAHPVAAKNWFEGISLTRGEFWLARTNAYGLAFDPDHMTLVTSPEAAPLWGAISSWMEKALHSNPLGRPS